MRHSYFCKGQCWIVSGISLCVMNFPSGLSEFFNFKDGPFPLPALNSFSAFSSNLSYIHWLCVFPKSFVNIDFYTFTNSAGHVSRNLCPCWWLEVFVSNRKAKKSTQFMSWWPSSSSSCFSESIFPPHQFWCSIDLWILMNSLLLDSKTILLKLMVEFIHALGYLFTNMLLCLGSAHATLRLIDTDHFYQLKGDCNDLPVLKNLFFSRRWRHFLQFLILMISWFDMWISKECYQMLVQTQQLVDVQLQCCFLKPQNSMVSNLSLLFLLPSV